MSLDYTWENLMRRVFFKNVGVLYVHLTQDKTTVEVSVGIS